MLYFSHQRLGLHRSSAGMSVIFAAPNNTSLQVISQQLNTSASVCGI
jgi:hypothetical protein